MNVNFLSKINYVFDYTLQVSAYAQHDIKKYNFYITYFITDASYVLYYEIEAININNYYFI